jgi:Cu+-exporting ATPase
MQKLVDRVAGYFAYVVMAVSAATFAAWFAFASPGDLSTAIIPTVAILVVACPCALGLATPTAIMVGMGKAASVGVIFKSGDAIENLSKITHVVFDKTGTLTVGKPVVTDVISVKPEIGALGDQYSDGQSNVLALAATAENYSEHPLAKAIVGRANELGLQQKDISDFQETPGMGVMATIDSTAIRAGKKEFLESLEIDTSGAIETAGKLQSQGKTVVYVAVGKDVVGIIGLLDTPKPEAKAAIAELRSLGIEPVMLTGDNKMTAQEVARLVGIDRVYAGVLPSGKVDVINEIRGQGKVIAMIGDGINDAPALTAADVGIAVGSGTDLAIEAGSVVLVRNNIHDVVSAYQIARKTVGKIKQNLAYAFLYNIVLVPVAALGLLYPALAGLAMAASSVSVTTSSLLLKRWKPTPA